MNSPEGMSIHPTELSPAEAIDRFEAAVTSMGMKVFARIDYAADAAAAGLPLDPTILLIFGNPKVGTMLLQERQTAGMDLPLKALAWTAEGQNWLGINLPSFVAERHSIGQAPIVKAMTDALEKAVGAALGSS